MKSKSEQQSSSSSDQQQDQPQQSQLSQITTTDLNISTRINKQYDHQSVQGLYRNIRNKCFCFFVLVCGFLVFGVMLYVGLKSYHSQSNTIDININATNTPIKQIKINISQQVIQKNLNKSLQMSIIEENNNNSTISEVKKQIKIENQQERNREIDRYYNQGLKSYYQQIQKTAHILKVEISNIQSKGSIGIVINALNIVSNDSNGNQNWWNSSVSSLMNHLNMDKNHSYQVIWLFPIENKSQFSIIQSLKSDLTSKKLIFKQQIAKIDSSFTFITANMIQQCQWIVFMPFNIVLNQFSIDIGQLNLNYRATPSIYITNANEYKQTIKNTTNLINTQRETIENMILLCRKQMVQLITPLNFAIQNVYTFTQLIILPIIALSQMLNIQILSTIQYVSIEFEINKLQYKRYEFILHQLPNTDKSVCYIGTPSIVTENNGKQLEQYLQNFYIAYKQNNSISIHSTIILVIIYRIDQILPNIHNIIQHISNVSNINIRIKLRLHQVSPPLEVYQSCRFYCPKNSIIFSSRFNTHPQIMPLLASIKQFKLCENKHVLVANHIYALNHSQSNISASIRIYDQNRRINLQYFDTHFQHAQIFCSFLVREMLVQVFKWQELQFYSTQASFAIPLIQRARNNYYYEKNTLFKIINQRERTEKEKIQIQRLIYRDISKSIQQKPIKQLLYNQLINHAYKQNPANKIPKIIHQIWLSNKKQISPVRKAIQETILTTNPDFTYKLWTMENTTRQNFPIIYDGILKIMELEKESKRNFHALIADLMRIQILYKFGGIYLDFKVQVKKSLEPFLKYEEFYFMVHEEYLTNGVIGSAQGNRHYKKILKDFFRPQLMTIPKPQIFSLTGGSKIIQAYTLEQIYTQVYSIHQFIYEGERPCVFKNNNVRSKEEQKIFEGLMAFPGTKRKYKIIIPCKLDEDKYMELYDIIGRTYIPGNQQFS